MLAKVVDGQVQHILNTNALSIDGVFYTDVSLLSKQEQEALGLYPTRYVQVDIPEGFFMCGSSYEFQCGEVLEIPAFHKIQEE